MEKTAIIALISAWIAGIGAALFIKLILLAASVVFALIYIFGKDPRKSTSRKALASIFFFLYGLTALVWQLIIRAGKTDAFTLLILAGLALGAAGDVLLEMSGKKPRLFMFGGAAFAAGHLFYVAGFLSAYPGAAPAAAAAGVLIAAAITLSLCLSLGITGKKRYAIAVYAFVLSFMACCAVITAAVTRDPRFMPIAPGAVLFLASDILLAVNMFSKKKRKAVGTVCLICYYAGQLLIASGLHAWI